ncbi:UNVERIFIED_CONTAM: hypothetical protein Slati_3200900 [Sesamum latifolium]|uniref:RNase H type-1 domain-containing protein n=1 Tax=Sesamum latifolium TaxID=2727402 RepID=A0AAW2UWD7_9LAMI
MVWCLSTLRWRIISDWGTSARDWVFHVGKELEKREFDYFLVIWWSLWWSRNKRWTDNVVISPANTVEFAADYLRAFSGVLDPHPCLNTAPAAQTWVAPSGNIIKINSDAAIFHSNEAVGIGAVAQDSTGKCIAWKAFRIHRNLSPEVAEAWAARIAITLGKQQGWSHIILETDCATRHAKLMSTEQLPSTTAPVIHEILELTKSFLSCSFSLVRRTVNVIAHNLARHATGSEEDSFVIPDHVWDIALAEMPQ